MGYTLGIDLGTTFTAAAVFRDGRVEIVPLGNHAATIPSLVFLREDGSILIGDAAERRGQQEPSRLAKEFKRRFGDTTPILLDRTPMSAERLAAVMLRQVVSDISARQGSAPDAIGVAHPANWGQFKVDLLRQAVQLAGVPEAVFVAEPIAAAIQYAASERMDPGEIIVVYDLGGGTFDAAVVRKTATGFETLGQPQGIERLGGIDFDEAVFAHVRRALGGAVERLDPNDPSSRAALARLRQECVAAKESVSSDSDATVPVFLPNAQTEVRLTRHEFEEMIRPTLRETVETMRRAITVASVKLEDVKAVLLAGGSSRIPLVAELVRAGLERPVAIDTHPKQAVSMGAARVAAGATSGAPVPAAATPTLPATQPGFLPPSALPPAAPPPPPSAPSAPPTSAQPPGPPAHSAAPPPHPPATVGAPLTSDPAPPKRSKRRLVVALVALVAVVGAAVGVGFALKDDDKKSEDSDNTAVQEETLPEETTGETDVSVTEPTTSATETTETETTVAETTIAVETTAETVPIPEFVCGPISELCVRITSITQDGETGQYLVTYETDFEPVMAGPDDHHVHFFWNTIDIANAGVGGDQQLWVAWDRALGEGELVFNQFFDSNAGDFGGIGATAMCIAVAFADHSIDADSHTCFDLAEPVPTPGE